MREITGVFNSKRELDKAMENLSSVGVKKENISLLAREKEIQLSLGKDYSSVLELRDEINIPRIGFLSEKSIYSREAIFVATLFYLGVTAAVVTTVIMHQSVGVDIAVAFFAGTVLQVFAMFTLGIFRKRHGDYLERKLKKGGLLFWIEVDDKVNAKKISTILKQSSAHDVRVRKIKKS